MKKKWLLLCFFYCTVSVYGQQKAVSSSEILHGIQKLQTLTNAMYVAAHPDDENTLLISWLSKEKKARTAYMALTRGDGGQNLIGNEQGEYVGLLRTHELLEARKIDGGEQYFSRAVDFGFTKKTDEAMLTWGREKILEDLVFQIRKFKPDVIINRFPPDDRAGHGHHSASAVLSAEAFDAAADPTKFTHQLQTAEVWQAKRLVWNSYSRGFNNEEPKEGSSIKISLGDYNPLLGKSYPEISAEARSKHRSQGFGSSVTRNERYDYALHIKGDPAKVDLFDGIDITWNRLKDGQPIDLALQKIIEKFNISDPSSSVNDLVAVYKLIEKLPASVYTENKKTECVTLIMQCAGIYFETNPSKYAVSPGQKLKVFMTGIKRSNLDIKLIGVKFSGLVTKDTIINYQLTYNKAFEKAIELQVPKDAVISQPYWLRNTQEKGVYSIADLKFMGLAMAPDPLLANFEFEIFGQKMIYATPSKYKYTEPSIGEIYRYLEVRPEVMINLDQKVYIFSDNKPKKIGVTVESSAINSKATISLELAKGWKSSPEEINVVITEKYQKVFFEVTPPVSNSEININAIAKTENGKFDKSIKNIKYDHIPELNLFPTATAKANKINIKKLGQKLGYIAGAGDEVPEALKQIGYDVTFLNESNINSNLAGFDAILVGVRAYNTEDWLVNAQPTLLEYVKGGGNLIIQYQTQAFYGTVKTKELGPFPISIGRGRVTDENAEMKILKPNHPVLLKPNLLNPKDFDGWVQERGLYFADKWSDKYDTIFAIKDQGETEQEGALLIAKYGKGNYVFTGLSLFRQLPAGVPGAYKLMSNLISIGKK